MLKADGDQMGNTTDTSHRKDDRHKHRGKCYALMEACEHACHTQGVEVKALKKRSY